MLDTMEIKMSQYQIISVHSNKEIDFLCYPKNVSVKKVLKDFFAKWKLTTCQESSFKVIKHSLKAV
jgi:hypothetical protein